MKHMTLCSLILGGLLTTTVFATPVNQAALTTQTSTVAQALQLKDDAQVRLTGKISQSVGDEKYQFKDASGSIVLDIDDELWQAKPLMPNQTVTIIGEVDVDHLPKKRVQIDVEQLIF